MPTAHGFVNAVKLRGVTLESMDVLVLALADPSPQAGQANLVKFRNDAQLALYILAGGVMHGSLHTASHNLYEGMPAISGPCKCLACITLNEGKSCNARHLVHAMLGRACKQPC